jgi:hypothetical protein
MNAESGADELKGGGGGLIMWCKKVCCFLVASALNCDSNAVLCLVKRQNNTMKTSLLPQMFIHHSCRIGTLVCCLTFLLASVRSGQGQFAQQSGTNQYNFYDYNGNTSATDGVDPSAPWSGQPLPALGWFNSNPPWSDTIDPTLQQIVTALNVSGSATFTLGPNPTPTGAGTMTLNLVNNSGFPDEVRLDWEATYVNNGVLTTIPSFTVNVSGTMSGIGSYWELAGGMTIYYANNTYTASIAGTPSLYPPAGPGPWIGALGPGPINAFVSTSFAPVPAIAHLGTFVVQGYLDLIVDPATVQVQIVPLPEVQPPTLGILAYSNAPVVFYPTAAGSNYVLQMTTNLQTGNWVTVSNGVPFSGLQITNAPSPAFFRLQSQ